MGKFKFVPTLLMAMFLFAVVGISGQIPTSFPDHDVDYTCTAVGNEPVVHFKYTSVPSPSFVVNVSGKAPSGDTQNPTIVSVTNSAGADIGTVKLLATNAGLAITVTANDNIGIVGGKLEMDGKLATPFGNGFDVLPSLFYVRFNSKSIDAGTHSFKLTVWDAAQNKAERTWVMTK